MDELKTYLKLGFGVLWFKLGQKNFSERRSRVRKANDQPLLVQNDLQSRRNCSGNKQLI